jgi:hypothetical protein
MRNPEFAPGFFFVCNLSHLKCKHAYKSKTHSKAFYFKRSVLFRNVWAQLNLGLPTVELKAGIFAFKQSLQILPRVEKLV